MLVLCMYRMDIGEVVDRTCFDFLSDSNIATVLLDDDEPFSTEASDLLLELCSSKSHPGSIASTLLHLLESISESTFSHSGVPFTPAFLSPNPVVFTESVFSVETKMTSRLQGPVQVEPVRVFFLLLFTHIYLVIRMD